MCAQGLATPKCTCTLLTLRAPRHTRLGHHCGMCRAQLYCCAVNVTASLWTLVSNGTALSNGTQLASRSGSEDYRVPSVLPEAFHKSRSRLVEGNEWGMGCV